MVQDPWSREGVAKFEHFPWIDTLVPVLTCALCVIMKKFDSTHAWGWISLDFLLVVFVQLKKSTVCVVFPHEAISCLVRFL